mgnify:CR=1 FL=1
MVAGLCVLGVWGAPVVVADPQPMPDRWTQFVTDDGWTVDLTTTNEVIDHIDNIAGASNSWQARVSLRSQAKISGTGASPIQDAQLESGYFVGCRTDSSAGVEVGGDMGIDPYQQINGQVYGGGYGSGCMAFTGPPTSRFLLVTDAGKVAVHVIDVVGRVHAGYVAAPGSLAGPRGVAARGSLVAVTAWKEEDSGVHAVHLFEGSGCSWSPVRVLCGGWSGPGGADGQLYRPRGLRFTSDGTGLAVSDDANGRVSLFRVGDGSFVRHVATGLSGPMDVEECEGGWLVACFTSDTVEFVGGGVGGGGVGRATLGKEGSRDGEFLYPSALALVPGLGLVVREFANSRVQVFATPEVIAMIDSAMTWFEMHKLTGKTYYDAIAQDTIASLRARGATGAIINVSSASARRRTSISRRAAPSAPTTSASSASTSCSGGRWGRSCAGSG